MDRLYVPTIFLGRAREHVQKRGRGATQRGGDVFEFSENAKQLEGEGA